MMRNTLGTLGAHTAFAIAIVLASLMPAKADDYLLGSQDKLRIRVVEWQTVEGAFREWTAISGEYMIDSTGRLSVPFVGEMEAGGLTTAEISKAISDTLQQSFGLSDKPQASVEIATYRPFYINGDVQAPGQYAFVPGITVLKAVSLAGGQRRLEGARIERDFINARGQHAIASQDRVRLLVRRARLEAEAKGEEGFVVAEELEGVAGVSSIMADEMSILTARNRKLTLQLDVLNDLRDLLQREVTALEQKSVTQQRQIDLARRELSDVDSLAQKGLVVNTRVLGIERTIADMEGKQLDLETSMLRARQEISKTEQEIIGLRNNIEAEVAQERQKTEAELDEATLRQEMYAGLLSEAVSFASTLPGVLGGEPDTTFELTRVVDGVTQQISAGENTPVLPGDIISVRTTLKTAPGLPG